MHGPGRQAGRAASFSGVRRAPELHTGGPDSRLLLLYCLQQL